MTAWRTWTWYSALAVLFMAAANANAQTIDGTQPDTATQPDMEAAATHAPLNEQPDRSDIDLSAFRDPFWPVGWTPPKASPVPRVTRSASPIRWDDATRMLEVTAMTQNSAGAYVAILRGIGVVEVGDTVSVTLGDLVYRWEVREITNKGIVPRRLGVTALKGK